MSIEKRINIRQPLTDQEEKCGHTYYGLADIDTILGTFESLPGLDRADFARVLEDAAWWYVNFENEERDQAASTRERFWQKRLRLIEDLLKKLNLTDRHLGHLKAAARDVDKRDGAPRGFEPEHDPLPPTPRLRAAVRIGVPSAKRPRLPDGEMTIWPVERQIQSAFANLEWLRSCVEQAKARANKRPVSRMSAFGGKADSLAHLSACPLIARSGHLRCLNSRRKVAHRDADEGAVHCITNGHPGTLF